MINNENRDKLDDIAWRISTATLNAMKDEVFNLPKEEFDLVDELGMRMVARVMFYMVVMSALTFDKAEAREFIKGVAIPLIKVEEDMADEGEVKA